MLENFTEKLSFWWPSNLFMSLLYPFSYLQDYTTFTWAHKSFEIWIVYSLISPLRQLIFSFACLFIFFSLRKLRQFAPFKKCGGRYSTSRSTKSTEYDHRQKIECKDSTWFYVCVCGEQYIFCCPSSKILPVQLWQFAGGNNIIFGDLFVTN